MVDNFKNQAIGYSKFAPISFSWNFIEKPSLDRYISEFYSPNKTILEAGCGSGRIIEHLISKGVAPKNITGVDINKKFIELTSNRNLNVRFIQSDLIKATLPKDNYDLIICSMVMEQFDSKRFPILLSNFHRWLKEGGTLFYIATHPFRAVSDELETYEKRRWINANSPWNTKIPIYHRTISDFINTTIQAGFKIQIIDEPMPTLQGKKKNYKEYQRYLGFGASRLVVKAVK